ncbi:MAG: hypothetical protein EHM35_07100 [Planctomycetaceae bacterium]|nr:MAG: hypothetical protein EHM35_07100 [Planctomycetaceae bacterium]
MAQRLGVDIASAYESEESPSGEATPAEACSAPTASPHPHEKASAAVERTLKEVCSAQPALSLRWFLKGLRARLDGLATFGRLRARRQARFRAARALRQQAEDTYTPIKEWQRLPGVEWRSPTEPFIAQSPTVVLSRPVPLGYYFLAIGLAAVGLGMIALGGLRQQEAAMAAGGILAIWASLLAVLPVRWVECRRTLIPHGAKTSQQPSACSYHKCMPEVQAASSLILLVLGAGGLGWAILAGWKGAIGGKTLLYGGLSVVGGLIAGVLIYLSTTTVSRPRKAPGEGEVPDLAPPWNRRRYMAGLISLTVAWLSLCLGSNLTNGTANAAGSMAGLGAILLGLVLAQLPRRGTAELTCAIPKMPQKLIDLEEEVAEGPHLATQVESLQSWVDRLLAVPETSPSSDLDWNETNLDDLLPKMFTAQWRRQLAEAFRKNQEMRSGKSLKQMVDDPEAWTRCLMEGFSASGFDLTNPLEAFWRYHVERWLEEEPLEHLISQLGLDSRTVVSAIVASVPPRWPQTRGDCDVDTSAIAVGKELWNIMTQFSDPDDPHRFAVIDWQDRHTVAVIRIVQGLSRGWRGFPALPSQRGLAHSGNEQANLHKGGIPHGADAVTA